jgi:hypothetical protein
VDLITNIEKQTCCECFIERRAQIPSPQASAKLVKTIAFPQQK